MKIVKLANDDHHKLDELMKHSKRFTEDIGDIEQWVEETLSEYITPEYSLETKQQLEDVQAKFEVGDNAVKVS